MNETFVQRVIMASFKCPVCGMDVDQSVARHKTVYKGKIYYFCSKICYDKFRDEPKRYIQSGSHHEMETH